MNHLAARRGRDRTIARLAGIGVALLGATAFAGWLLHNEALKTIVPGSIAPIKPNMTIGMLLCGTALALLSRKKLTAPVRRCGAAMGAIVLTLCVLTLAEFLFDQDFGIDRWLIGNVLGNEGNPYPGRMTPLAALSFALAGIGLLTASQLLQRRLRLPLVAGLGGILMAAGGVPFFGFFLELLFGPSWNYMGMSAASIPGALTFFLLGSGLLALLLGNAHLVWSLDRLTTAGFFVGFVLMILASGLFHNFALRMYQAGAQVSHAQQILTEIQEVEANLFDLESAQRIYIITGREVLLGEWDAQASEVRKHTARLQKLAAANSPQQPNIRQLATLVYERILWANKTVEARREKGFPAAQEMVARGIGIQLAAQTREVLKEIESDELARLDQRQAESKISAQRVFLMLPMGVFFCCAILSLGLFFLNAGMGERKRVEDALRVSEESYRRLFEDIPNPMWVVDGETLSFLAVNQSAIRLYGYSAEEFLTMNFQDLRPSGDLPLIEFPATVEDAADTSIHSRHRRKDGPLIDVEVTSHALVWDGRLARVVLINDVSERIRAEETASRLQKVEEAHRLSLEAARFKNEFVATMSHELRTPLNAVVGFTGTLLMELPGPINPAQRKQLETIRASARHQLSLINDLLDLAKIESGRVELQLGSIACQPVVLAVAETLRPAAEKKGLTLHLDLPADTRMAHAEERALKQILFNLVNNAIKFTEQGEVRIALLNGAKKTRFAVTDTGRGIEAEDQPKLFKAFSRLEHTSAERVEGTGLGLHLSQKLAELMGGEIKLESEAGHGSTFTLVLDAQSPEII